MTGCLTSKQINIFPMKMKVVIFLGLLAAVHCFDPKGGEWHRKTVNQTEDEVDVEISDGSGNPLSESDIFEQDGYEVMKPKNRNVCLIKQINDSNTCFDEQPLTIEPPSAIQTRCFKRHILLLSAIECDDDSGTAQGNNEGRQKRQASPFTNCCLWDRAASSECAETYCCKKTWFFKICIKRCCKRWTTRIVWTKKCVEGYVSTF